MVLRGRLLGVSAPMIHAVFANRLVFAPKPFDRSGHIYVDHIESVIESIRPGRILGAAKRRFALAFDRPVGMVV